MSALILWLDKEQAKLFQLDVDGVAKSNLHFHGHKHGEHTDEEKFYHQLCQHLNGVESDKWLIVGPGVGREHFLHHLERHHPNLKSKIVGSEKMEVLTDNQIVAEGKKFFHHLNLFESV
ncbi:MAG: hypothetical protein ACXVCY_14450 [Pseudobdellovibrionaceae bacterium]